MNSCEECVLQRETHTQNNRRFYFLIFLTFEIKITDTLMSQVTQKETKQADVLLLLGQAF